MGYTSSEYGYFGGFASLTVAGNIKGARFMAGVDTAAAPGFTWQDDPVKGLTAVNGAGRFSATTGAGVIVENFDSGAVRPQGSFDAASSSAFVGTATYSGAVVNTPATAQSILAVGTAITTTGSEIREFTCDANYTLTAAPTIANGTNGQRVTLVNVGSFTVTIQDQGTLASSNLRLTGATVAIGPRDSIDLYYSTVVGDWVQIGALVAVV